MKSRMMLLIFIWSAAMWALTVTVAAERASLQFPSLYLNCPWAGIALGTFGGFLIGALGLRVYAKTSIKEAMQKMRQAHTNRIQVSDWDAMEAPSDQAHCTSYTPQRSVAR